MDVDLRWGITDERQAEVLPICLHEIDLCRPYFIGVLGDRYGTVPPSLPAAAVARHPWLLAFAGASITELEIRHGALNARNAATGAFFYFRAEDGDAAVPAASDPRLNRLRDAIRDSRLPLREGFPDAETLGEWVVEDLWSAIDREFPGDSAPDELDRSRDEHEAFGAALTTTYVARAELFERLDAHANSSAPLVILGRVGTGKTALVANWAARRRVSRPDEFVVVHFIGCTPESTELSAMLERIIGEIARRHGLPSRTLGSERNARDEFPRWLAAAAERGRMVLVLDGLDQLESGDGADLAWLPFEPPPGICIILSLRHVPGVSRGDSRERLARRAWKTIELQPLRAVEMRDIATQYLSRHGKSLSPTLLSAIERRAQASNPLFLTVLLEELRVFWSNELLERQLASYLDAPDTERLYDLVLDRLEADHAERHDGLVQRTLSLLWAARQGLSEAELSLLLARNLWTTAEEATPAVWPYVRYALGGALVSRSGLLGFAHDELRRAVERRYLADPNARRACHQQLGNFFTLILFRHTLQDSAASDPSIPAQHAGALARLLAAQAMTRDERARVELPWQWEQAGEWSRLRAVLTHPRVVSSLHDVEIREQLGRYWRALAQRYSVVDAYDELLEAYEKHANPRVYGLTSGAVGSLLCDLGYYAAAERVLSRGVEALERCNIEPIDLWTMLGNVCEAVNSHDQARRWHERALAGIEKAFGSDSRHVSSALNALAIDHLHLGHLEQAGQLLERALEVLTQAYGADSYMLADTLANLGSVRQDEGQHDEARRLMERALLLVERRFGNVHFAVAAVVQNLGDVDRQQCKYEKALAGFRQAGAIIEEALGRTNRYYAASLFKQSEALEGLEAYADAVPLLREAWAIRRALYAPGDAAVIACIVGIIDNQLAQGDFAAARAETEKALGELETLGDLPERSLAGLRQRLSDIDDIVGYAGAAKQAPGG